MLRNRWAERADLNRCILCSRRPECRGVRAKLVGDQEFGCKSLLLEQLAHQPQRRPSVAPTMDQHIEDLALVIDGTPQIHPLAGDANDHLIQVPPADQLA